MKAFKVISAKTSSELELKVNMYDLDKLGSLTILNGHYFLGIVGALKTIHIIPDTPWVAQEEPWVTPKEEEVKPQVTRKPRGKPKPTIKKAPAL